MPANAPAAAPPAAPAPSIPIPTPSLPTSAPGSTGSPGGVKPPSQPTKPAGAPSTSQGKPPTQEKRPLIKAFEDLDAVFKVTGTDKPKPPPSEEPIEPDGEDTKTTDEPSVPRGTDDKPPTQGAPEKAKGAAALRQELERSRDEIKRLTEELSKYKKPADDTERTALMEQLKAEKEARTKIEEDLKYAAYERSPEYKDKFEKPIQKAFESAYKTITQLGIVDEDGNITRTATVQDFNSLLNMPVGEAIKAAKMQFGDAAWEVIGLRRKIVDLNDERNAAIEEYRTKGTEREKALETERATRQDQLKKQFVNFVDEQRSQYPQLFDVDDEDPDGNKLLTDGRDLADAAFYGHPDLNPEQLLRVQAAVRNRAAGFARVVKRNETLKAEVQALKDKLAAFEASSPSGGQPAQGEKTASPLDWDSRLKEMFK